MFTFLCRYALSILINPSHPLSPKVTDAHTKLKIPELTIGNLALMDRQWHEMFLLKKNLFAEINYPSVRNNTTMTILPTGSEIQKMNIKVKKKQISPFSVTIPIGITWRCLHSPKKN